MGAIIITECFRKGIIWTVRGKIHTLGVSMVKLILRKQEFEVRPGMTLLSALQKMGVLPEGIIATCAGELIEEDEILKDGDVIKLISAISGG
jgi:sulfur carrier protein